MIRNADPSGSCQGGAGGVDQRPQNVLGHRAAIKHMRLERLGLVPGVWLPSGGGAPRRLVDSTPPPDQRTAVPVIVAPAPPGGEGPRGACDAQHRAGLAVVVSSDGGEQADEPGIQSQADNDPHTPNPNNWHIIDHDKQSLAAARPALCGSGRFA